jgi:hypothetical protein
MNEAEYILRGLTSDDLDRITDALSNESAALMLRASWHRYVGESFKDTRKSLRDRATEMDGTRAKILGQQSVAPR